MFTIQYETVSGAHKTETFEGTRRELIAHLARFERPIVAVYEQVTVVTKAVRTQLIEAARNGTVDLKTLAVKTFVMEGMRLTTPA